jgi:hypothetical protein
MLDVSFGDEGAIDELAVLGSSGQDAPALEPRDDRRDCRLRQLSLGVELLPDLSYCQLALIPEEAEHRGLEIG